MTRPSGVRVTWLGHSTFKISSAPGKILLIDPWLSNNPPCPAEHKSQRGLDLILMTHGHFDHFEDAVGLAREHRPAVVANFEICQYWVSEGVANTRPINKGGSQALEGVRATMVPAPLWDVSRTDRHRGGPSGFDPGSSGYRDHLPESGRDLGPDPGHRMTRSRLSSQISMTLER